MTDIEKRKAAALNAINLWVMDGERFTMPRGKLTKSEERLCDNLEVVREVLQPSPPVAEPYKLSEQEHTALNKALRASVTVIGEGIADGEVDEAVKNVIDYMREGDFSFLYNADLQTLIRAAQQPRQEWMTMESAPRNGTWIIIKTAEKASLSGAQKRHAKEAHWIKGHWRSNGYIYDAIGWMPLPSE